MTALIVWACIIGYFGIGALMHPMFALAQYSASKTRSYSSDRPDEAAGYAVLQAAIWPVYLLIWRSTGLINKDIELQKEMQKVREQIEDQRRLERRKAQHELEAFDREMRKRS